MNKVKLGVVLRNSVISNKKPNLFPIFSRWRSKNEDDTSENKQTANENADKKNEKNNLVLNKLNSLLKEMVEEAPKSKLAITVELAKPIPKKTKKSPPETEIKEEERVVNAVKQVAESLGRNTKQTESELMKKLLNNTEEASSAPISSLSDIFKGMKIDRSQPKVGEQSRSQQVRELLKIAEKQQNTEGRSSRQRFRPKFNQQSKLQKLDNIDLFGSAPLGIFTADPSEYIEGVKNTTWNMLMKREMKLAVTHPPSNYFQQMILWTEQEKLWKFPIDNEQGMEEEQDVYFADHIFLEKHLEPWCPPRGPIRHFMELVCVGLSKNPYLTVKAKREHIEWYRNYFEDKRQLLKEVGASLNEIEQIKEIEAN